MVSQPNRSTHLRRVPDSVLVAFLALACAAAVPMAGCGKQGPPADVKPAAPAAGGETPKAPPAAPAADPVKSAPPKAEAAPAKPAEATLPKGVDAADLDPAERKVLAEILDEQFDPCGKPRSFRAGVEAGDCALAMRLVRFCVHKLQQGYGKRKIVGLMLREVERLNTVVQLDVKAAPVLGPADAKVKVVIFSDFECPFCRRAATPVAKLREHYNVALIYMHYPLEMAHPHAEGAARAAWAAQQQGKFWQMHDALFAHSPDLAWDDVKGYAKSIGLDLKRFAADVESPAAKAAVAADKAQGSKAGVDGTPTFFVNGRRAETIEQLQEGIREALSLAGVKVPDEIQVGEAEPDAGADDPGAAGAAPSAPAAAH